MIMMVVDMMVVTESNTKNLHKSCARYVKLQMKARTIRGWSVKFPPDSHLSSAVIQYTICQFSVKEKRVCTFILEHKSL